MAEDRPARIAAGAGPMNRARGRAVLFVENLAERGGGGVVGAWAAQTLLGMGFRVEIVTWDSAELAEVDADYGTCLADDRRLSVRRAPAWMRRRVACRYLSLALLRRMVLERWARAVVAREDPDLVVSTSNETDLGRPLIQYLHYPWAYWPRPDAELRWFHWAPVIRLYRGVAHMVGGFNAARMAANTTLANSDWTADLFRRWYGLPVETLNPPVPVPIAGLPWEQREEVVLCVARTSPEKRLVEAIGIVGRLRAQGHDLRIWICGKNTDGDYRARLERAVDEAGPWAELHLDLSRAALIERMGRARYGLHTMIDEHFGIAIAEMVRMGCLTFAHASGGAKAIVGDPRLGFATDDEAVERIARCRADAELRNRLRAHLADRAGDYGAEAFVASLRAHCERMLGERPPGP